MLSFDNQQIDLQKHSWASLNATLISVSGRYFTKYKNAYNCKTNSTYAYTNFSYYFGEKNGSRKKFPTHL